MNQNETRIQELCALISVEQDREKFLALVEELNTILSSKGQQIPDQGNKPGRPTND